MPPLALHAQHDDAIMQNTYTGMTAVTDGRQSADGCPVRGVLQLDACALDRGTVFGQRACICVTACKHLLEANYPSPLQAVATMFVTSRNTGERLQGGQGGGCAGMFT